MKSLYLARRLTIPAVAPFSSTAAKPIIIYALIDADRVVRYVGCTKQGLAVRFEEHLNLCKKGPAGRVHGSQSPLYLWMADELRAGREPSLVPLDYAKTENVARLLEWSWITGLRSAGCQLLNKAVVRPHVACTGEIFVLWCGCGNRKCGGGWQGDRHAARLKNQRFGAWRQKSLPRHHCGRPDVDCDVELPVGWPFFVDGTGEEEVARVFAVPPSVESSADVEYVADSLVATLKANPALRRALRRALDRAECAGIPEEAAA